MIKDAESILKVCGVGNYLYIGCGESKLVFDLLKRSINAYGIDASAEIVNKNLEYAPGRFFQGSIINYPFNPDTFDTVIIGSELTDFKTEHLPAALAALLTTTKRNLVLYFAPETIKTFSARKLEAHRIFWEKIAIQVGFRLHPRSMLITPYHELENEQVGRLMFFERVPEAALKKFPMEWLLTNRDLHMDMLREAGRRSDGHVSRYVLAANKIRPGDTVLDAACGLGYGTAVMAACSKGAKFIGVDIDETSTEYGKANFSAYDPSITYQTADVSKLSFIPDHSVDIVVSFETIEHLQDYEIFLTEVKRVLKPDGRFIGSVPNLWCDETGKDPNPYHFHVFDWNKLNNVIGKYFIVEDRWAQTAGGGYKLHDRRREMCSLPLKLTNPVETEWWIISACVDPRENKQVPYTNSFQSNGVIPEHINIAKHYDNPWLYRTMVQLGERIADKDVLSSLCVLIANETRAGSADQGAALCVLAYQLLEYGPISVQTITRLVASINTYIENYDRNNIHAYRWAISLHYVGGRLLLLFGNRDEALSAFLSCAEMDPFRFSPLLATKTISARMYAGLILVGNEKFAEAAEQFRLGVEVGYKALQSDWANINGPIEKPLSFGLQEIAEVADIASQCAHALHALEREKSVPGQFWDSINLKRFGIVEWTKSVERENEHLRHAKVAVSLNQVTA